MLITTQYESLPEVMKTGVEDRHSLVLLVSLLFFMVLSAFVRDDWVSEVFVALSMYAVLIIATLKISEKRRIPWAALLLTASSLLVTLVCVFRPVHILLIANWIFLSTFFGYVSIALFAFLERPGTITKTKLFASLGLYLILGMFYYALFNLIEVIHQGSFMEAGRTPTRPSRHSLLYLSLATLTTVGYGDVLPVSRPARMIAVLEAVTGVFYIAITVARLVAAYKQADSNGG